MSENFRPINRAVGLQPKIGAFGFYQIVLVFVYSLGVLQLRAWLDFSWVLAVIIIALLSGITFLLFGDQPWLFFSRLTPVPYWVRSGADYSPLLKP